MKQDTLTDLLSTAIHASVEAGIAIMEVYDSGDLKTNLKEDQSPLTVADMRSHAVITSSLKRSGFPILSEEGADIHYEERKKWNSFWMVDPLDGTKEFIKRNGEFTVNIAFIQDNNPVLGVIYLPVLKRLYYAVKGQGGHRVDPVGQKDSKQAPDRLIECSTSLPVQREGEATRIIASRSHLSPETKEYIEQLEQGNEKIELLSAGSSLKLCLIAEGKADVYPRLSPTMEWDIAAGHIIVTESGGAIMKPDDTPVTYNKPDLLNPWFVAKSKYYLANSGSRK
jgi:3'(2'), 5'-bisphosphate nucleotidase